LIHFALLGFSKHVHDLLVSKGYDLFAKTDVRFLEAVFKLLRQEFAYQPQVSLPHANSSVSCGRVSPPAGSKHCMLIADIVARSAAS